MIELDLGEAWAHHAQWITAQPFPHIVIREAISPEAAAACAAEYPPVGDGRWHTFHGPREEGKQEASATGAGPAVAEVHALLASGHFVDWLAAVSGIPDIVADPDRAGGGIHQSGLGARLAMHVDFNRHPTHHHWVRAVNAILFVGWPLERWDPVWGGLLTLGAAGGPGIRDVLPEPGTLVLFEASDTSWHGHPVPLQADPRDRSSVPPLRRSIPAYYYRPIRPGETIDVHSTRFLES